MIHQVYAQIQKPVLGLIGTTSSLVISISAATVIIHCVTAIVALTVGL